jgi:hypothetical protein
MPGVFDRLQNQIENKQQEGGITALDLAQLAPPLRKIMRLMLRELELTRPQLGDAMQNLSESDRLSPAELDQALATLTGQFWLIRMGEEPHVTYKVNLRRKAGSTLAKNIWASLDTRLKGTSTEEPPDS